MPIIPEWLGKPRKISDELQGEFVDVIIGVLTDQPEVKTVTMNCPFSSGGCDFTTTGASGMEDVAYLNAQLGVSRHVKWDCEVAPQSVKDKITAARTE